MLFGSRRPFDYMTLGAFTLVFNMMILLRYFKIIEISSLRYHHQDIIVFISEYQDIFVDIMILSLLLYVDISIILQ